MTEHSGPDRTLLEIMHEVFGVEPQGCEDGLRFVQLSGETAVAAYEAPDGIRAVVTLGGDVHTLPTLSGEQFKIVCGARARIDAISRSADAGTALNAARELGAIIRRLTLGRELDTHVGRIRAWLDRHGGAAGSCPGVVATQLWMGPDAGDVRVETHWVAGAEPVSLVILDPSTPGRGRFSFAHACLVPLPVEQRRLVAQRAEVAERLAAVGERHREVANDPPRVVARAALAHRREARRQRLGEAGLVGDLAEQRRAGV